MPITDVPDRDITYYLEHPLTIDGDTPDDGTPNHPFTWQSEDSDERVTITLDLSLNEYIALSSAIDVGRDIAYGIETNWIWWIWVRSANTMALCAQLIACIETDPDVSIALQQFLEENGYAPIGEQGTPQDPGVYNDNPLLIDGETIEDCDNDNLYGAIVQFIDFINRRIVDVFEIIESETNIIERSQIALEAFPITDTLAADSAAAFADQLLEEIAEGYDAAFTEELEEEYGCDLFCLVKDTCELSFQTFADYFNGRIGATPPDVQFSEYIEWFLTGDFTGSNIVDAAYSLVCAALSYHSSAFGMDIEGLLRTINSALNDPNPDWVTLCDDCVDFPIPYILTANCWDGTSCGTNLTHISGTRWSVTVTHRTTPVDDYAFGIGATGDIPFKLTNVVFPGLTNPFAAAWKLADNTCNAALYASSPALATTVLKELVYTWGIDGQYMEFDMINP